MRLQQFPWDRGRVLEHCKAQCKHKEQAQLKVAQLRGLHQLDLAYQLLVKAASIAQLKEP